MSRLVAAWNRHFFSPARPTQLALCRIVMYALLTWQFHRFIINMDVSPLAEPSSVFWQPPSILKLFLPRFSPRAVEALMLLCRVAVALSCVGLLTRLSTAVALVSGFCLMATMQCYGKIMHQFTPTVFLLAIMALARSGDALSIDRLLLTRLGRARPLDELVAAGEYRWPVQWGRLLMVLPLFLAGISKLRHSGLDWALSDEFRNILLYNATPCDLSVPAKMAYRFAKSDLLCRLLGASSLLLELLAPLALVSRRLAFVIVPSVLVMLFSIKYVMWIFFSGVILGAVFWVPWHLALGRWLERPAERG